MTLPPFVKALLDPLCYPDRPAEVELVQTHISYLFLTPSHVYKVKKPINFGFLDFTSLEKRKFFCHKELVLNRRLSPEVYLNVVEIKQEGGKIRLGGKGRTIEYAVKMKRIPDDLLMKSIFSKGMLTNTHLEKVAEVLALFREDLLLSHEFQHRQEQPDDFAANRPPLEDLPEGHGPFAAEAVEDVRRV